MSITEGCRKQARRCAALAATVTDPELEDELTSMAQNWMTLALINEGTEALVDHPPKPIGAVFTQGQAQRTRGQEAGNAAPVS